MFVLEDSLETKKRKKPVYLKGISDIGPMYTENLDDAVKFDNKQDAMQSPVYVHPLCFFGPKDEFDGMSDRESVAHQLKHWVNGVPLHNTIRDECCPDFSCCNGGKIMPVELRKRFEEAVNSGDKSVKMEILGMGLSSLLADTEINVFIVGDKPGNN